MIFIALILLCGFGAYMAFSVNMVGAGIGISIVVVLLIIFYVVVKNEKKEATKQQEINEKKVRDFIEKYNLQKKSLNIPESAIEVIYKKPNENSAILLGKEGVKYLMWKGKDELCFFPSRPQELANYPVDKIKLTTLPINQVELFA